MAIAIETHPAYLTAVHAISAWRLTPGAADSQVVAALHATHAARLAAAAPGTDEHARESGYVAALAPRHTNARLSEAVKRDAPIGPTEGWTSAHSALEAAWAAARIDLANNGITDPTPRQLDMHARAKLQARINLNAAKYAGKRPRWLAHMRGAVALLKKAIAQHPKPPATKPTRSVFPQRRGWRTGRAALTAARRVARKSGGTRAASDRRAADLLADALAMEPEAKGQVWWEAAQRGLHALLGKLAKRKGTRTTNALTPAPLDNDAIRRATDLLYASRHEQPRRPLTDSERVWLDEIMETMAGAREAITARIADRLQYETRSEREAARIEREVDRAPLAYRQADAETFHEILRLQPERVVRDVRWLLNGDYGYGEMKRARALLQQRKNPGGMMVPNLVQLAGVYEYRVPRMRTALLYANLPEDTRAQIVRGVVADVDALLSTLTDTEIAEDLRRLARGENPVGVKCPACGDDRAISTGFRAALGHKTRAYRCGACQHQWPVGAAAAPLPEPPAEPPAEQPAPKRRGTRTPRKRMENARHTRAENPADPEITQLADQFVNGDAPQPNRLPLTRSKSQIVVYPDEAFDFGRLVAFEYRKDRPGVAAAFFIHTLERKPFPLVFLSAPLRMTITPSGERQFNPKGAKRAVKIDVVGPAIATGMMPVPGEVADGGHVTKLWVRLHRGTLTDADKPIPFAIAEIAYPANSGPRLDFSGDRVTITYTRDAWDALPASKRVFGQYQGPKPVTKEGHGF